jgi:hypothetical protein
MRGGAAGSFCEDRRTEMRSDLSDGCVLIGELVWFFL